MRQPMKKPKQSGAFERPRNRQPFAMELRREDERDEEQRHAAKPRQHPETRGIFPRKAATQIVAGGQRRNRERCRNEAGAASAKSGQVWQMTPLMSR